MSDASCRKGKENSYHKVCSAQSQTRLPFSNVTRSKRMNMILHGGVMCQYPVKNDVGTWAQEGGCIDWVYQ
jgi:hypothetical protein